MAVGIDSWFDYGCPSSMITRHFLTEELAGSGVQVRWHPHESRCGAWDPVWSAQRWDRGLRPLADRLGVRVSPVAPANTSSRLALQGYQYAADQGRGDAYSDQVFSARFTEGQDIADLAVLAEAARRAGLDPERFRAAVRSPYYVRRHQEAATPRRSVRIAPTVVADGYRVEGVPTGAQMAKLIALSRSSPRASTAAAPAAAASPPGVKALRRAPGERTAAGRQKARRARLAACAVVEVAEGDLQEFVERDGDAAGQPVEEPGVRRCG
ncbi:DsbA family oxidoreductase [Streptomyces goshikiensis]|uniref:DsbA family oxidoreductase n=1 Tax=Streptomyces goshikiensis TaxID=1942 RepID=UPI0036856803